MEGLCETKFPYRYVEILSNSTADSDDQRATEGSFVSSEETRYAISNMSSRLAVELQSAEEELFMFILRNNVFSRDYMQSNKDLVKFIRDQWDGIRKVTNDNPETFNELLWSLHDSRPHSSYATSIHSSTLLRQIWYFGNDTRTVVKYMPSLLCAILKPTCAIGEKRRLNAFNLYMS